MVLESELSYDLKGLVHHSDRGCQYCCEKYVKLLQDNGILISMTQGGDPRDSAMAERVNGILKTEWLNHDHYAGLEDALAEVSRIIYTYNHRRPHLSLDYKTPVQAYEDRGEQKRVWKNYYKANKPEDVATVIANLTSGCRTTAQVQNPSGLAKGPSPTLRQNKCFKQT